MPFLKARKILWTSITRMGYRPRVCRLILFFFCNGFIYDFSARRRPADAVSQNEGDPMDVDSEDGLQATCMLFDSFFILQRFLAKVPAKNTEGGNIFHFAEHLMPRFFYSYLIT